MVWCYISFFDFLNPARFLLEKKPLQDLVGTVSNHSTTRMDGIPGARAQPANNETVSRFRQTSSQVLATTAESLLFLSMGMMLAFPSVVIPVLMKKDNTSMHFSTDQISWYGSFLYFFRPVGSLMSAALLQLLGCKRLMMLINIPMLASWLMAYYATSIVELYVVNTLNGLAIGLMGAPAVQYISEVSHPSLRSVLTTYSAVFSWVGFFVIYLLRDFNDLQHVALISASVPVICIIALSQIPETPIWLMSKGRPEDALKSLQWLRGWTSAEMVKEEHEKLQFYSKKPKRTLNGYDTRTDEKCQEERYPPTATDNVKTDVDKSAPCGDIENPHDTEEDREKEGRSKKLWRDLLRRNTQVPLAKCNILFLMMIFALFVPMRPYQLQVFEETQLPLKPNGFSMLLSLVAIAGTVSCMFIIKRTGKKPLGITAFTIVSICHFLLGIFLILYPPQSGPDTSSLRWWPVIFFSVSIFTNSAGLYPVVWTYLNEILPHRGRGITTGIVTTVYEIVIFAGVKTFPALEELVGLHVIFITYAIISLSGAFFVYFALPETEGRFLSDIEIEMTNGNTNDTMSNDKKMKF